MEISRIGEFGVIERLAKIVHDPQKMRRSDILVDIGDDCAAWRVGERIQLATTDTMIAGVHFSAQMAWRDVGWRLLAMNVSDIAAMGGSPAYSLVTLCLPRHFQMEAVEEIYRGLEEAGEVYGVTTVGGDIVRSEQVTLTMALIGEAAVGGDGSPLLLTRSAARPGDEVAITGYPGQAAAGLRVLSGLGRGEAEDMDVLVQAHVRPQPRLLTGQMAARLGVLCAIDVSDGLLQDLGHVCRASGVEAVVHAGYIPLSPSLARVFPDEALDLACGGGEDYEIVLAGTHETIDAVRRQSDMPVTVIGEVIAGRSGRVRLLNGQGEDITPGIKGWDHLRLEESGP